jgi:uncharacterized protein (DUF433 family)
MIPRLGGIFICNYPKISLFQVSEFWRFTHIYI